MLTSMQIGLIALYGFLYSVIGRNTKIIQVGSSILHGSVIGLILGNVPQGLVMGGTMYLMMLHLEQDNREDLSIAVMGAIVSGIVYGTDKGVVMGTALVALCMLINQLTGIAGSLVHKLQMNAIENKQFNKMGNYLITWNCLKGLILTLPLVLVMVSDVSSVLAMIPEGIYRGIHVAVSLMPAVGIALLMKQGDLKKNVIWLVGAFVLGVLFKEIGVVVTLVALLLAFKGGKK